MERVYFTLVRLMRFLSFALSDRQTTMRLASQWRSYLGSSSPHHCRRAANFRTII